MQLKDWKYQMTEKSTKKKLHKILNKDWQDQRFLTRTDKTKYLTKATWSKIGR